MQLLSALVFNTQECHHHHHHYNRDDDEHHHHHDYHIHVNIDRPCVLRFNVSHRMPAGKRQFFVCNLCVQFAVSTVLRDMQTIVDQHVHNTDDHNADLIDHNDHNYDNGV